MESGLRLIDDRHAIAVYRAYEEAAWRPDAKRATLDSLCDLCLALGDDVYCVTHTSQPDPMPQAAPDLSPAAPAVLSVTPAPPLEPVPVSRQYVLDGANG